MTQNQQQHGDRKVAASEQTKKLHSAFLIGSTGGKSQCTHRSASMPPSSLNSGAAAIAQAEYRKEMRLEKEKSEQERYKRLAERSRRTVMKIRDSLRDSGTLAENKEARGYNLQELKVVNTCARLDARRGDSAPVTVCSKPKTAMSRKRVFIVKGGYNDLKEALLRRGWVENLDSKSTSFDLKWTLNAKDIDYIALKDGQMANHFGRNREITTKTGLTSNLRNSYSVHNLTDMNDYYPRTYDLSDPQDVGDFILEYKLTKCMSILRQFLHNVTSDSDASTLTYGPRIVDTALRVCERLQRDINDVIDSELVSFGHGNISRGEWELLRYVSLDDPQECVDDGEGTLPQSPLNMNLQPLGVESESDDETDEDQREAASSCIRGSAANVASCARYVSASHYREKPFGRWTIAEAQRVLTHLYSSSAQAAHVDGFYNAWIMKPGGKSRGRGIQMMRCLHEILSRCGCSDGSAAAADIEQWVVQKYVERPLLIMGYKFDIRVWVLVTDWNPLSVWIWQRPYIRFASEKYDATLRCDDKFVHMVNNSIVKDHPEFHLSSEEIEGSDGFMWFLHDFQRHLHSAYCSNEVHSTPRLEPTGLDFGEGGDSPEGADTRVASSSHPCIDIWSEHLQPQIEEIVVSSLWCVFDNIEQRKGSCELLGYDFMISDDPMRDESSSSTQPDFRAWLIEVNSSPAMEYSTKVTEVLTKAVMEDTVKVLVDYKDDPSAPT
ncbi:Tubulin tyrosine ligase-like, member, partial [Perkinsus olseni]